MKVKGYLVVTSNGSAKFVKKYPDLNFNEVAVGVNLELPDKLFERPVLNATITVPDNAVLPYQLPVEVRDEIEAALASVEGADVKLTVTP